MLLVWAINYHQWALEQSITEKVNIIPEVFVCLTRSACRIEKQTALMTETLWVTFSSKQHVLIITVRDMDWKVTQGINMSTILKKAWRSWIERNAQGSANNPFLLWLYSVLWLFWYEESVYCVLGSLKILTGIFVLLMHKEKL